jgi:hypothetical protein
VAQSAAEQLLVRVVAAMAGTAPGADPAAVVDALLNAVRVQAAGMDSVRTVVEEAGGFAVQLADIEEVTAYRGDNYELLIQQFFKSDRATMLTLATKLEFEATSEDHSVLDALDHAITYWGKTRDFIPDHVDGVPFDLSFVSVNWRRAIRDRKHPGMLVKRHCKAMVFTYLAEELRTGDIALAGGAEYGDWSQHLLTFDECRTLLPVFCEEAGLPTNAQAFVAELKERHAQAAADLDAGYHDNEDLSFDSDGVPTLKRLVGVGTPASALKLGEAIKAGMPERTLIQILARTVYWLGWWRHFGPASGKEPKLKDPQDRYVLTTFACGSNMGPYEAARHIAGITAQEISLAKNRHVTLAKLNKRSPKSSTRSPSWTSSRRGAMAAASGPTAPRSTPTSTTCWPRPRSGTEDSAGSPTTTSRTTTSRSSPGSSLRGVGGDLHHRRAADQRLRRQTTTVHADTLARPDADGDLHPGGPAELGHLVAPPGFRIA